MITDYELPWEVYTPIENRQQIPVQIIQEYANGNGVRTIQLRCTEMGNERGLQRARSGGTLDAPIRESQPDGTLPGTPGETQRTPDDGAAGEAPVIAGLLPARAGFAIGERVRVIGAGYGRIVRTWQNWYVVKLDLLGMEVGRKSVGLVAC